MKVDWSLARVWLAVRFALIIAVATGLHVYAYRDIETQRQYLAERGFDSGRLELLSRLETEFSRVLVASRSYVEGNADFDLAKRELDVFWSRVVAGVDQARTEMYRDQGVDMAMLQNLRDALPQFESAINQLRSGDPATLGPLTAIEQRFSQPLMAFSDSAYAARVRTLQGAAVAQWNLFATLKNYQTAFTIYGAALLGLLLGELLWADRIVQRLKNSRDANRRLAQTDTLTGVFNRHSLDQEIQARDQAKPHQPWCAIAVDIDRFRWVNDALGHGVGDQLLSEVAKRVSQESRTGFVGRMSSDEFLVLLDGSLDDARRLASRIGKAVSQPMDIGDRFYQPSASIAIAECARPGGAENIIQKINATMLAAKMQGGGGSAEFHADMLKSLRENVIIETDLAGAIANGQIEIVAQPKFRLLDRSVVGYEALARWNHPTLGWVSPEKLCKIADSIGLSSVLGLKVADLAFQLTSALKRSGHPGRMSINVSPAFGSHPTFVGDMLRVLVKHGLSPSDVEFEVTEEAMLSDFGSARTNMAELRRLGAHVAIDDFGKGYSNISRLTRLAVSVLKLDRSTIEHIAKDRPSQAIVSALVRLAADLDLELIVEGVETEEQAARLNSLGVALVQGYLLARPMSPLKLFSWLQDYNRPGPRLDVAKRAG